MKTIIFLILLLLEFELKYNVVNYIKKNMDKLILNK